MKRSSLLLLTSAFVFAAPALARGKDTVILLSTSDPDQDEECTNFLAEALRSRGVSVVDPSSVHLTYHQKSQIAGIAVGPVAALEAQSVSWISRSYHSSRALFANISFHDVELPYGDFQVHTITARCSFRCMNVSDYTIVKAGSFREERRGEDELSVASEAANAAMLSMARSAASALS